MASRPRFFEHTVPHIEIEEEVSPYSKFPDFIVPQPVLTSEPKPDSFFATASIGEVQNSLKKFHKDRPEMWNGNHEIPVMLDNLIGELVEVSDDWDAEQTMPPDAYRAQEVADCLIFMLAIATQLGMTFDQEELDNHVKDIFLTYPRFISSDKWTKDHEVAYWHLFADLQNNILWLKEGSWPERFDALDDEQLSIWQRRIQYCFTLAWSLHRLYGLSPNQQMLDKVARNMGKYPAGEPDRAKAKGFYKDRNMNAEHFATEYRRPRPAELGRPVPELVPKVSSSLSGEPNLLR
jgi:NTP pyrophosphatase (non-canonical NTP hydrolase)